MASEIQRIAQALVVIIDELPDMTALLRARISRLHDQASELGDHYHRTGDIAAMNLAHVLHAAAEDCGRAVDRSEEAYRTGHRWVAEKVGGHGGPYAPAPNSHSKPPTLTSPISSGEPPQGSEAEPPGRLSLRLSTKVRSHRRRLSKPPANADIEVDDSFRYQTDERGRVVKAGARLNTVDVDTPRNNYAQRTLLGKIRGIDHAGHIFPRILRGPGNKINLVAMQSINVNLGEYASLEKRWRRAIENGKTVDVSVELVYDRTSRRPSRLIVEYTISGGRPRYADIENTP